MCKEVTWSSKYVLYGSHCVCVYCRYREGSVKLPVYARLERVDEQEAVSYASGMDAGMVKGETPLLWEARESRLQEHPDRSFRGYLVMGTTQGI